MLIVTNDKVVLDPEKLLESSQGRKCCRRIHAQREDQLREDIGKVSHQAIHLHKGDIDFRIASAGCVDLPHHVELGDHPFITGPAQHLHEVLGKVLIAELDLGVVRGQAT